MARPWLTLLLPLAALGFALAWPRETARAEMLTFASPMQSSDRHDRAAMMRVQADLARTVESWQGERDCSSPVRARAALRPVLANWLGARTTERPSKRLAQWGYHSGDVWHETRTVDGRTRCSGGFRRVIVYADFR